LRIAVELGLVDPPETDDDSPTPSPGPPVPGDDGDGEEVVYLSDYAKGGGWYEIDGESHRRDAALGILQDLGFTVADESSGDEEE
jgi:hypothetical protein